MRQYGTAAKCYRTRYRARWPQGYRFNRRFRLCEMLLRLARAMMLCKPHAEPVLRMASHFHG